MNKRISIKAGDIEVEGQLNDSRIANMIWEALPFNSFGKLWGHEIYFTVPVSCCLEDGQEVVPNGSLAYWPPGSAFCIFFGSTPASQGNEIRPASPVTILGSVVGSTEILRNVPEGAEVVIEQVLSKDDG